MSTTAVSGADVERLHAMAQACGAAAEQLTAITRRTTAALCTRLAWDGPDADALRARWRDQAVPAVALVAARLRDAGLQLVREAQQQLAASGAATGGGSPGGTAPGRTAGSTAPGRTAGGAAPGGGAPASPAPAPAPSSSLADRLASVRDALTALPGQAMLGRILAEMPASGADWAHLPGAMAAAERAGGAFEKAGMGALGWYSLVKTSDDMATAIQGGDVGGMIQNGVPLAFTAAGPAVDATLGTMWGVGTQIGTQAYTDMQGTRYGDIVQSMTDDAFAQHGAWGMLQVPGILGFAAVERLTEDPPPTH